jgi:hypothetical protein
LTRGAKSAEYLLTANISDTMNFSRRDFLKTTALACGG